MPDLTRPGAPQAIDASVLDGFSGFGGPTLIAQLIALYREQVVLRTGLMQAALDGRDAPQLQQAAHALRSSAGQIGAVRLAAACSALEHSTRSDALHDAPTLVAAVIAVATAAETWLREHGFPL